MNTDRYYPELISQLKSIRAERGLTLAEIKDMTDAQDKAPAPSDRTIQKVFAAGSEEKPFIYESSLKAIVVVLIGIDAAECYDTSHGKLYFEQLEAAKLLIEQKNQRITELTHEVEQLRAAKDYVKQQLEDTKQQMNNIIAVFKKVADGIPKIQ